MPSRGVLRGLSSVDWRPGRSVLRRRCAGVRKFRHRQTQGDPALVDRPQRDRLRPGEDRARRRDAPDAIRPAVHGHPSHGTTHAPSQATSRFQPGRNPTRSGQRAHEAAPAPADTRLLDHCLNGVSPKHASRPDRSCTLRNTLTALGDLHRVRVGNPTARNCRILRRGHGTCDRTGRPG